MKKKFLWLSPVVLLLLTLTSCDGSVIQSAISDALPNLWVTLAQIGAFLIMVFVFIRFGYKPLKKKLDARKEYVATNKEESDKQLADAKAAHDVAESNIKASRVQANQIVENAHEEAVKDAEKVMADANAQAELKRQQGDKDLEERRLYLEQQAHNQIVNTALDASKEILGRELTQKDNAKIVDSFIDQLKKDEQEKKK
jgi:F-type H+-transporting ATPase subunit b